VKANEAGLAARAARVRSKARGAAAGPSAPKEELDGIIHGAANGRSPARVR
jgi:hypothetical protein